jgi:hypothetical protein
MNRYLALVIMAMTAMTSLLSPSDAQAVPAFARQVGVSCSTCHFQHFPLLNSFGRAFKASGFTMINAPLIESDHFSIPANLDMALFSNIRYQKSNGPKVAGTDPSTSNDGEWVIPGETSLFVAGYASKHMGVLIEGDVGGAGAASGVGFLASLKVPIVYPATDTLNVGVVPFSSGLGPAYAFELLNTGAVGNHVMTLVHPTEVSAQQYIQVGAGTTYNDYGGDAEGMGLFAASGSFYITAAKWQPNHISLNSDAEATAQSTSDYLRAVVTPDFNNWDVGVGLQYIGGKSAIAGAILDPVRTEAIAFDAQAQGALGNMPFGVYFSYATASGTSVGELPNLYNPNPNRKKAITLAAELGAFGQGRGTFELAYRKADNGATTDSSDNALTLGVTYLYEDNVQLVLLHTAYTGDAHSSSNPSPSPISASGSGDQLTSLNLAIGF